MDVELIKLENAFKKLNEASLIAGHFLVALNRMFADTCREAVRKHYSNNWLKMHGYPMRRKVR